MKGRGGGEKDREVEERGGGEERWIEGGWRGEEEEGEGEQQRRMEGGGGEEGERRMEGEEVVHVTGSAECIHTMFGKLIDEDGKC